MLRTEWVIGHQWYVNKYAPSLSNQLDPRPDSPKIRSVKQLGGRSIFRKVPWNSSVRCPVELPRRRSVGSPGIANLLSIRSRVRGLFMSLPRSTAGSRSAGARKGSIMIIFVIQKKTIKNRFGMYLSYVLGMDCEAGRRRLFSCLNLYNPKKSHVDSM